MRAVDAVVCLALVLAAASAVSGAHAADTVPGDGPPAWATPAHEPLSGSGLPGVSPASDGANGTDAPQGNGSDSPGNAGNPGNSGDAPGNSGDAPGNSGDAPGNSGDAPGNSGDDSPGNGNGPPGDGDGPGNSGDAPPDGDDQDGDGSDESEDSDGGSTDGSDGPDGDDDGQEQDTDSDPEDGEGSQGESEDDQRPEGEDGTGTSADGSDDASDTQSATRNVSTPLLAQFDASFESFDAAPIAAGERIQVPVEVENVGVREGTFSAPLRVDGERVASASVTVGAGETETVVLEHRFDDPGEYEIAVDGTTLGTLAVVPGDDAPVTSGTHDTDDVDPATAVDVVEATALSDWAREGTETTARVTVVNTANQTVTRALAVTVDGQPVANESVTLGPGQREVVDVDFEAAGGAVAVEGVEAGEIDVGESPRPGPADDGDDTGSGFALALLVATLVSLASIVALDARELR